jgi:hypothetical protein
MGQKNSTYSLPDAPTRASERGVQAGQLISNIDYSVSLEQADKCRYYELNDGAKSYDPFSYATNRYRVYDMPESGLINDQDRRNYDEDDAV